MKSNLNNIKIKSLTVWVSLKFMNGELWRHEMQEISRPTKLFSARTIINIVSYGAFKYQLKNSQKT